MEIFNRENKFGWGSTPLVNKNYPLCIQRSFFASRNDQKSKTSNAKND